MKRNAEKLQADDDSGAACHIGKYNFNFRNLKKSSIKILLPNGHKCKPSGQGTMLVKSTKSGAKFGLSEALYVPKFQKSLFSVPRATSNGMHVLFKEDSCEVFDPKTKEFLLTGSRHGDLYYLNVESDNTSTNNVFEKLMCYWLV